MGKRRTITNTVPVDNYITIHPALDFWLGHAIVSVGGKWLHEYDDNSVEFDNKPLCVLSGGEKFLYSKRELADRQLFHTGTLDIPLARWNYDDIEQFGQYPHSESFPAVFQMIQDHFSYYMDFWDKRLYSLFPCFILYTYFYPMFHGAPIIQLWGEFRTGKTKICSLIDALAFNPVNSANISSSSIFRLVESRRATVLLDESEDMSTSERMKDIRNMLLAGTGKSGQTYRQERMPDDSFQTRSFRVFSPKLIANITGLGDIPALQSRTIRVTTLGAADKIKENRAIDIEEDKWQDTRNHLYRLCLCRHEQVYEQLWHLEEHGLSGRSYSLWQGILTMARLIGDDVWADIVSYAQDNKEYLEAELEYEADKPLEVIRKLINMMNGSENVRYTIDQILNYLSPAIPLTSKREVGVTLGRLGFYSKASHGERYYVFNRQQLTSILNHR
jgi:hypothetical protein